MELFLTPGLTVLSHHIIKLVLLLKVEVKALALTLCLVWEALSNLGPVAPNLQQAIQHQGSVTLWTKTHQIMPNNIIYG